MNEWRKPPLGVIPRHIWERQRYEELRSAILNYADADLEIPSEWIFEYNKLASDLMKKVGG